MKTTIKTLLGLTLAGAISSAIAADKLSVAEIHAKRIELGDKQVTISGKVIKVNNGIMRRNFIHVQDDTVTDEFDRVIITSQQTAEVGDQVTATGTVKLDTDFGMGYFYPTLVEQATLQADQ